MSKLTLPDVNSSPIFLQLRDKKILPAEEYDQLWKVMQKLGYCDFLTIEQGLITLKFLKGENIFGVLPTSGGKSFTYQTVARMTDGLTIVISPLIALMRDQVGAFRDGAALYFNSDLSPWQKKDVKRRIKEGKVKLLFISPERLKSTEFKDLLHSGEQRVKRLVIDEAHCVVEWGYGFRVKYLHIAQEIDDFEKRLGKDIPILLLTATASPWLQKEIVKNLQINIPTRNFITQQQGADRPELSIHLHHAKNDTQKIRWLAKQLIKGGKFYGKRGIIFSAFADGGEGLNAKNAPTICEQLEQMGVKNIDCYHGSMALDERRRIQNEFDECKLNILVATKAFGMGIDLPKLDFIIHFYPPISLEEYWQEAGRGGRGMKANAGENCQCIVLHNQADYLRLEGFPNLASFGKILSTFSTIVQGELYFNTKKVSAGGRLRKLLDLLHKNGDIRPLKSIRVGGISLERWKLRVPASRIVKHIDAYFELNKANKVKQTKRLRNILRIRANSKGKIIRIEQSSKTTGPALDYYNSELNWFTEPEIKALAMIDDGFDGNISHTRYKIWKEKLTLQDMKILARKVNGYRKSGYAKLNYVFSVFLGANHGEAKVIILDYLQQKKRPA
jgi:RecQ family ATP-dependent DNA helicase